MKPPPGVAAVSPPGQLRRDQRFAFNLIAVVFTLAYAVMTVIAVHLLTLLQARAWNSPPPSLSARWSGRRRCGRLVEMAFGGRAHPIWTLLVSSALVALGDLLLIAPGWGLQLRSSSTASAAGSVPSCAGRCRSCSSARKATRS